MTRELFRNTAAFGAVVRSLREAAGLDRTQVDRLGGPDRSYINQIESGQDMPITDATLTKLGAAFSSPTNDVGNSRVSSSFLYAYAAVFEAREDPDAERARDKKLCTARDAAQQLENLSARTLIAGVDVATGAVIRASAVAGRTFVDIAGSAPPRTGSPAAQGRRSIVEVLTRIALRQPALTLVSRHDVADGDLVGLPDQWRGRGAEVFSFGVAGAAHPKAVLDPIAGVGSLDAALERAAVLGARGTDAVATAWAILVANAHGLSTGVSPIAASAQQPHLRDDDFPGARPTPDQLQDAFEKYLLPWALEHTTAAWNVQFVAWPIGDAAAGRHEIEWSILARENDVPDNPHVMNRFDLCVTDNFPQLAEVLAALGIPAITVTPTRLVGDEHVRGAAWELHPIESHPAYALMREENTQRWRAVQLFAAHADDQVLLL